MSQIDINTIPFEYCNCGCPYFRTRTLIKKISGISLGAGAGEKYLHVNVMICEGCETVFGLTTNGQAVDKHIIPGFKFPRPLTEEELAEKIAKQKAFNEGSGDAKIIGL
jgi:hypothetical protein